MKFKHNYSGTLAVNSEMKTRINSANFEMNAQLKGSEPKQLTNCQFFAYRLVFVLTSSPDIFFPWFALRFREKTYTKKPPFFLAA